MLLRALTPYTAGNPSVSTAPLPLGFLSPSSQVCPSSCRSFIFIIPHRNTLSVIFYNSSPVIFQAREVVWSSCTTARLAAL